MLQKLKNIKSINVKTLQRKHYFGAGLVALLLVLGVWFKLSSSNAAAVASASPQPSSGVVDFTGMVAGAQTESPLPSSIGKFLAQTPTKPGQTQTPTIKTTGTTGSTYTGTTTTGTTTTNTSTGTTSSGTGGTNTVNPTNPPTQNTATATPAPTAAPTARPTATPTPTVAPTDNPHAGEHECTIHAASGDFSAYFPESQSCADVQAMFDAQHGGSPVPTPARPTVPPNPSVPTMPPNPSVPPSAQS